MAPQTTEFGAKVGLLAGLALMSPLRTVFDRLVAPGWDAAALDQHAERHWRAWRVFGRGAVLGAAAVVIPVVIVVAGWPARPTAATATDSPVAGSFPEVTAEVDPTTLPDCRRGRRGLRARTPTCRARPTALAVTLAENLAVEAAARREPRRQPAAGGEPRAAADRDGTPHRAGRRRQTTGGRDVSLRLAPPRRARPRWADSQLGASLGFDATGTIERATFDEAGAETGRATVPFATTFVLNQATGDRWLIVDEIDG